MKKILVAGPVLTRSGYGEMARFALRSLKSRTDVDLHVMPTTWGNTGWMLGENEELNWINSLIAKTQLYIQGTGNKPTYDVALQISIPNEWKKLAPINIGYTAGIETNMISPAWLQPTQLMDKVVVISDHAKAGFINTIFGNDKGQQFKVTVPVETVHLPYRNIEKEELPLNLKYDFNFLSVCQWGPRKNLDQTIVGFLEEFRNEEVGLVLKINTANDSIIDRHNTENRLKAVLSNYPNRKCSITLLHGHLSEGQMQSLFTHSNIKAIVSTTHGEGYGLPLMEAAANAMPVIATDWSAHTEFLYMPEEDGSLKRMFGKVDYELKPIEQAHVWQGVLEANTQWAFPIMSSYKNKLRDCFKDYGRYKSQAKKLAPYVKEKMDEAKLHEKFSVLIAGEKEKEIDTALLPKVSIIASVFNADKYIEQYLEDVTRQTIFKDKCELVLINPNSPGNEEPVIKKYMEKFPNIVYKRLDKDPGLYATWNLAIQMASGEFITNANLDDRKAPWSLEKHAKALYSNSDVDLVYADSYVVGEANVLWENVKSDTQRSNMEQYTLEAMLRSNPPHNNPMWRKSLHEKHGMFEEKYKSAADWELWLRSAFGGSKFMKINEILGAYYFNPEGVSTNPENASWKQQEEKEIFKKYMSLYQERTK
jgi:hypothetical protein